MRYAVYISGKSSRLKKYLLQSNAWYESKIIVVVSDSIIEKELSQLLIDKGIIVFECNYKLLEGVSSKEKNLSFSNILLDKLLEHSIDYCFSFGSHILSGTLLEKYKNRIINFHPSILPMYPGLHAIDQAENNKHTFLVGNTAHFIDTGVDSGPIIMQSVVPIRDFVLSRDYDIILDLQIPMLKRIIRVLENNDLLVENDTVVLKNADYSTAVIFPHYLFDE